MCVCVCACSGISHGFQLGRGLRDIWNGVEYRHLCEEERERHVNQRLCQVRVLTSGRLLGGGCLFLGGAKRRGEDGG